MGERQCRTATGLPKKAWRERSHAVLIAREMQDSGRHVEVYRCGQCDQWHVGRQRKRLLNTGQATRG